MSFFSDPAYDAHEGVHLFHDEISGLRTIIAIHSTHLGPAAGGCRVRNYENEDEAMRDALRLSRGMTYKNALAGLSAGGGKAVIMAPRKGFDRAQLFTAFGRAVDRLGGQYITAEDVGSTVLDMQIVAQQTSHVAGLPPDRETSAGGDPSPWTALGVFLAIETAVNCKLGRSLAGVRVSIQGLGNVGYRLCEYLHDASATLIVSDLSNQRVDEVCAKFGAQAEPVERIHSADADVFAPCALGGGLNARTIPELKARIVCGGANNQLEEASDGGRLWDRDILYCPDYVVNAGGIINVMAEHAGHGTKLVEQQVQQIPHRLCQILEGADRQKLATNLVADALAREIAGRA